MLALFPLQLVVYPNEKIALHIFEERYQQLLSDCEEFDITFGIPTYLNKKLEYGTEVFLKSIEKKYADGRMDIICYGKRVFKIENFYKQAPGKLYAGGEVTFLKNTTETRIELQEELQSLIDVLYRELNIDKPPIFQRPVTSFQVAHKVGLSMEQEYYLLTLQDEIERLKYITGHIKITLPVVREMNRAKEVIKMNGHFKNFDPLDFEEMEL